MERKRIVREKKGLYLYEPTIDLFTSGCTLLDCVLGGGWATRRIINIVGDKSTGKTLLAIEACATFYRKYGDDGLIYYNETEAAFDRNYAQTIGLPEDKVRFVEDELKRQCATVQELFDHLEKVIKLVGEKKVPTLYVVDSLDALSSKEELERKIDKKSYETEKAKAMSRLFRQLNAKLSRANVTVVIISQTRDKIGAKIGRKQTRSGGRALDFYASQVAWISHIKILTKQRRGVKRPYGIRIRIYCDKNKVGPPFRECIVPIHFNYGIEDLVAGLEWLIEVKRTKKLKRTEKELKNLIVNLDRLTKEEHRKWSAVVSKNVMSSWSAIEKAFQPSRRKYE
jgi:recombination protein RecA